VDKFIHFVFGNTRNVVFSKEEIVETDAAIHHALTHFPVRVSGEDCLGTCMAHTDASWAEPAFSLRLDKTEQSTMDDAVLHFVQSYPVSSPKSFLSWLPLYVPAVAVLLVVFANKDAILSSKHPVIPIPTPSVYQLESVGGDTPSFVLPEENVRVIVEQEEPEDEVELPNEEPVQEKVEESSGPEVIQTVRIGNAIVQFTNQPTVRPVQKNTNAVGTVAADIEESDVPQEENSQPVTAPKNDAVIVLPDKGGSQNSEVPDIGGTPSQDYALVTIQSRAPAHQSSNVSLQPSFSIVFSADTQVLSSYIEVYSAAGVLIERVTLSPQILQSGSSFAFSVQNSLQSGTEYYVLIPADAFAGFAGTTANDWRFVTETPVQSSETQDNGSES